MSGAIPMQTMGSPPENESTSGLLEDYIDHLCAPLVGNVPFARRQRFLAEVAAHLEALVEDYRQEGETPEAATRKALREHGAPGRIAEDFLAASFEKGARGAIERRFGRANCTAFGAFVMVQAFYLLLLQVRVFEPNGVYYRLPLSPSQIRQVWPSPLPYPEASPWFFVLIGYPLIAPFFAGWWAGRRIPSRAATAVYHALVPLILCSFTVGVCLLPVTEGVLFALVQLGFWLPMGALSAHIASLFAHARRMGNHPGE